MKWMSLVTQDRSFLADPFRNTHDLRLSCRSKCVCTLHATTEVFAMGVEIRGTVDVQNRSRTEPCGCRSCRLHHDLRPHSAARFRMSNFSVWSLSTAVRVRHSHYQCNWFVVCWRDSTSDTTRPRVSLTAYFTGLPAWSLVIKIWWDVTLFCRMWK